MERLLDDEVAAAAIKRQIGRTPAKTPEPSPNVAPLKRSKVVPELSPLKPVSLEFSHASDAIEATLHDQGSASSGLAGGDPTLCLLEGLAETDVYNVVPEFGDTLVVPDEDCYPPPEPNDGEVSKVLAQVGFWGKQRLQYGFWLCSRLAYMQV